MLYGFILIAICRALYALYTRHSDRAYQRRWDAADAPDEPAAPPSLPHARP